MGLQQITLSATVGEDGSIVLTGLPLSEGQQVEVTIKVENPAHATGQLEMPGLWDNEGNPPGFSIPAK